MYWCCFLSGVERFETEEEPWKPFFFLLFVCYLLLIFSQISPPPEETFTFRTITEGHKWTQTVFMLFCSEKLPKTATWDPTGSTVCMVTATRDILREWKPTSPPCFNKWLSHTVPVSIWRRLRSPYLTHTVHLLRYSTFGCAWIIICSFGYFLGFVLLCFIWGVYPSRACVYSPHFCCFFVHTYSKSLR